MYGYYSNNTAASDTTLSHPIIAEIAAGQQYSSYLNTPGTYYEYPTTDATCFSASSPEVNPMIGRCISAFDEYLPALETVVKGCEDIATIFIKIFEAVGTNGETAQIHTSRMESLKGEMTWLGTAILEAKNQLQMMAPASPSPSERELERVEVTMDLDEEVRGGEENQTREEVDQVREEVDQVGGVDQVEKEDQIREDVMMASPFIQSVVAAPSQSSNTWYGYNGAMETPTPVLAPFPASLPLNIGIDGVDSYTAGPQVPAVPAFDPSHFPTPISLNIATNHVEATPTTLEPIVTMPSIPPADVLADLLRVYPTMPVTEDGKPNWAVFDHAEYRGVFGTLDKFLVSAQVSGRDDMAQSVRALLPTIACPPTPIIVPPTPTSIVATPQTELVVVTPPITATPTKSSVIAPPPSIIGKSRKSENSHYGQGDESDRDYQGKAYHNRPESSTSAAPPLPPTSMTDRRRNMTPAERKRHDERQKKRDAEKAAKDLIIAQASQIMPPPPPPIRIAAPAASRHEEEPDELLEVQIEKLDRSILMMHEMIKGMSEDEKAVEMVEVLKEVGRRETLRARLEARDGGKK